MELIDTYRTFYPQSAEHTLFSSAHGIFSITTLILGHKKTLNKFKKIEISSNIFSDHHGIKTRNLLQEDNWKKTQSILNSVIKLVGQ